MIEELFHIGSFAITPFGVMMMLAFLSAFWQLGWGFKRLGIGNAEDANAVLFAAAVGGVVGGKVYYATLNADWRLLFDRAGLVWYGGFIGGAAAVLFVMRRRGLPMWRAADAAAPALAIGYAVGRIGCFLVGDDYGLPSEVPWAVAFPVGLPPSEAYWLRTEFGVDLPPAIPDDTLLRVHPTQLYETLLAAAIFWWGRSRLRAGSSPPGKLAMAIVAMLALERFAVEFLRAKDDRFLAGLTLAQGISLAVLVVALTLWSRRRSAAP